jgi:hypothetical protein
MSQLVSMKNVKLSDASRTLFGVTALVIAVTIALALATLLGGAAPEHTRSLPLIYYYVAPVVLLAAMLFALWPADTHESDRLGSWLDKWALLLGFGVPLAPIGIVLLTNPGGSGYVTLGLFSLSGFLLYNPYGWVFLVLLVLASTIRILAYDLPQSKPAKHVLQAQAVALMASLVLSGIILRVLIVSLQGRA